MTPMDDIGWTPAMVKKDFVCTEDDSHQFEAELSMAETWDGNRCFMVDGADNQCVGTLRRVYIASAVILRGTGWGSKP